MTLSVLVCAGLCCCAVRDRLYAVHLSRPGAMSRRGRGVKAVGKHRGSRVSVCVCPFQIAVKVHVGRIEITSVCVCVYVSTCIVKTREDAFRVFALNMCAYLMYACQYCGVSSGGRVCAL